MLALSLETNDKTTYVSEDDTPSLTIRGNPVIKRDAVKLLGVLFDTSRDFSTQNRTMGERIDRELRLLRASGVTHSKFCPRIVEVYTLPKLLYGWSVWANHKAVSQVGKLASAALRISPTASEAKYLELGWLHPEAMLLLDRFKQGVRWARIHPGKDLPDCIAEAQGSLGLSHSDSLDLAALTVRRYVTESALTRPFTRSNYPARQPYLDHLTAGPAKRLAMLRLSCLPMPTRGALPDAWQPVRGILQDLKDEPEAAAALEACPLCQGEAIAAAVIEILTSPTKTLAVLRSRTWVVLNQTHLAKCDHFKINPILLFKDPMTLSRRDDAKLTHMLSVLCDA
ncbi:hypothetical protein J8273_0980 [Carpediemonas membranifera]|uniref:Uncharacterized protein n=1 Tax=Carpediemonas membranifera TaxID=201153 RepID=A0A8J6E6G3_9EUKA|nr:hypothetical protein J8273_0980 [Carpediemonas membranifera]|eukprot:KAG9397072.1 hypothetical protein J8273_0980 [Carpediemonas membranifera]